MPQKITHTLRIEMDLLDDAMRIMSRIMDRLEDKVDCASVSLEIRMERALDQDLGQLEFVRLDNERSVAIPPKIWRDLIDEARSLGVL